MSLAGCLTSGTAGVAAVAAALAAVAPPRQTFRAATELVLIDAHVVGRDGTPVAGLKPDQFEVFIDGRRHPIERLEFLAGASTPAAGEFPGTSPPASPGAAAPAPFSDGRVFVVAIDQPSFPLVAQSSAREAVRRVVDAVSPEDYLGFVAIPGKSIVAPTRNRQAVRDAANGIQGQRFEIRTRFNISASEAGLIKAKDAATFRNVQQRECGMTPSIECPTQIRMDADQLVAELHRQASGSIGGLHGVIDGMASLPGRKTLLVISAGLPMSTRPGVEPNVNVETGRLAAHAASANVNLYVFFMNVHFLRAFSAEFGTINNTLFQDMEVFGSGLEKFADSANGTFFQIQVDADPFVARVMRETSAYYLLGVAPEPRERDGKAHFIRVETKARGATVRHRLVVTIPVAR
jgi:VWFA-related protein